MSMGLRKLRQLHESGRLKRVGRFCESMGLMEPKSQKSARAQGVRRPLSIGHKFASEERCLWCGVPETRATMRLRIESGGLAFVLTACFMKLKPLPWHVYQTWTLIQSFQQSITYELFIQFFGLF